MKILKTASGKKTIKMSKKDWNLIGRKAGWIKESNLEFDHRDPKNYAPGQTPYKDEQWEQVQKLIKDEAHSRDFKEGYNEDAFPIVDKTDNSNTKGESDVQDVVKNSRAIMY